LAFDVYDAFSAGNLTGAALPSDEEIVIYWRVRCAHALPVAALGDRMESSGEHAFVDQRGNPLDSRIQQVLKNMLPRIRNRFHSFGDELLVAEILEEAGSRIADQEKQSGPVENLNAYAWSTVLNVARSRMRRSSMRLVRETLGSASSEAVFGRLRSNLGTPEQIETNILLQELMARLTPEERAVCTWKQLGFSSREIAQELGTSIASVDTMFYRIKRKLRSALESPRTSTSLTPTQPSRARTA
jgi:RNA polymerase sigma factor (sigma-70 family)